MYIYIYIHTYIHTYICIYMHTYTHIHTRTHRYMHIYQEIPSKSSKHKRLSRIPRSEYICTQIRVLTGVRMRRHGRCPSAYARTLFGANMSSLCMRYVMAAARVAHAHWIHAHAYAHVSYAQQRQSILKIAVAASAHAVSSSMLRYVANHSCRPVSTTKSPTIQRLTC